MLAPNLSPARNWNLLRGSTILAGLMVTTLLPVAAQAQEVAEKTTRLEKLTVGGAAKSIAEDNDTVVPTRNISALKTDTPLIETPRAVSVVTRKELEERGVQDMIQATRYTAGVTTGAFGYDPRFDQIHIRGISTTTDSDFHDGLRQPYMNYGTFTTEVYTLDRIENPQRPGLGDVWCSQRRRHRQPHLETTV
ncbi:TonB-dependent receptor plug domain-containing protein [Rhizobium sp. RCAM05350]|nr:TonB-dependent receptor plug domain-containing protein [Rhizobium sp. RCAM05350]